MVFGIGLLAVLLPAGWFVIPHGSGAGGAGPMLHEVAADEFVHDVTERGNVESARNTEIISKVKSSSGSGGSGGGTTILEIVPEGTVIRPEDCLPEGTVLAYEDLLGLQQYRAKLAAAEEAADPASETPVSDTPASDTPASDTPASDTPASDTPASDTPASDTPASDTPASETLDDEAIVKAAQPFLSPELLAEKLVLVQLDASSLEDRLIQQQIVAENSRAVLIQSNSTVEVAEIALNEYVEGTHEESLLDLDIQIKEAVVELSQARQYLEFSQRLERKGYITKQQLQDDKTRVTKAENALKLAQTKRRVLEDYNKKKMEKQLQADILTAKAKWKADEISLGLDEKKLREIEDQIASCTIFAAVPGQVVYANVPGHRGRTEVVIELGTPIRENQVIIRLPDSSQMQVKALINEAHISLVDVGMQSTIRLDAFPDAALTGVVEDVGAYPAQPSWLRPDVKDYETIIKIFDPRQALPSGETLRPGLTAQVKIRVKHITKKVIQVPVQTIIEHGAKHYCVFHDKDGLRRHEVTIGPSNEKFVVIEQGLDVGQKIVLNAAAYREQIELPELPPDRRNGMRPAEKTKGGAKSGRKPPNPVERFNALDTDGDGKLTGDELQALPAAVRPATADTDGDGAVDRTEFIKAAGRRRETQRRETDSGTGRKPEISQ